jgi:hypothetical protein
VTNAIAGNGVWAKGASSSINYVGGSVGIGTTSPSEKLTIAGSTTQDVSLNMLSVFGGTSSSYSAFLVDSLGNISLNAGGQNLGGNISAYSKIGSDTVPDIYTASLDRGGGNGGIGFGLGYLFRLESGGGTRADAGRFKYAWKTPTAGAETSTFTIQTKVSGTMADSLVVDGDKVGIGTSSPGTLLTLGSGQLSAASGTAALPAYTFSASPSTGIFSSGTNLLDFATSGVSRWSISAGGTFYNSGGSIISNASGSATNPTYTFISATDAGRVDREVMWA